MSSEIMFHGRGKPDIFFLASNGGLADLGRWVESLPDEGFETLKTLFCDGTVTGTSELRRQLKRALVAQEPTVEGVAKTAEELLKNIGLGRRNEHASIIH